ncbi:beta-hydroxyacyl-ACP dehydratase [Aeoliella sp. ICT_H6.2]|uniref:Beta-hydroxyacyl-ACP dehydratase n=1 Tax=Aeoliella straminimaris TaxID=2954799 RepID=A0A9X2FBD2_9BACT|nr:beta-hydroxyacyl-ACP dehydratase [Aeoliella straminimaris]MCO6045123.1 beta-hydroxyacyl-ACP dehydratase [Aeoliella straminimaris]
MRWLWVDRFTEFVGSSHAVGHKGVALSDPFMHDHWDAYPTMPHTLMAEGMAQTGGLLVSELYEFKELVVLAKFSKLAFHGITRGGDSVTYRAEIENVRDIGSSVVVSGHCGDELRCEGEIFFARLQAGDVGDQEIPKRLFDPADLLQWLLRVGIFEIGVKKDGTRMHPADYGLPMKSAG